MVAPVSAFSPMDYHLAAAYPVSASQSQGLGACSPAGCSSSSGSLFGSKLGAGRHGGRRDRVWMVHGGEDLGLGPKLNERVSLGVGLPGWGNGGHSVAGGKRALQRANAESGGSGNNADVNVQATLEQSKRLLAMQRELLDQVDERKKLYSAVVHGYDTPTDPTSQPLAGEGSGDGQTAAVGRTPAWSSPSTAAQQPLYKRPAKGGQPIPSPVQAVISPVQPTSSPLKPFTSYIQQAPPSTSSAPPPTFSAPPPTFSAPPSTFSATKPVFESKQAEAVSKDDTETAVPEVTTEDIGAPEVEKPPPLAGPNVMNVVMVAAECAPWSKTGGLGDVAGALPKALARRGHRTMVVAPRYGNYPDAWETGVRKIYNVAGQDMEVGYFHGYIDGVDYVFVDNHVFHHCAKNIYGGSREEVLFRMILLCKAAVEAPWHVPCGGICYGDGNLVFIANDWHTALLPVYLQAYYREKGLMQFTRSVIVIHNMAHQGRGPLSDFNMLGLPPHYKDKFRLFDPLGGEHCNIFMAGLLTAHRIVAVSHGYAWECQTPEGGWGLDGLIRDHNWKLRGVVNGIDAKEWNPELDVFLTDDGYAKYSIDTLETGKAACKAALQKELGLPVRADVPLLGFIGRLDHQKGVDIIAQAMPWMMEQDLQLVMLGTGRADLEDMLRSFEGRHRDKVRGWVGFSVKTAHRITAGVDILLMPSRFEPCGLNQLYAMRYGTVPVVHSVGGLRDTVQPFDPFTDTGLGWTFDRAEAQGLIHAVGNAMWTYKDFKPSWLSLQKRGMSQDLSWDNAAEQYEEVLLAAKYQW